MLSKGGKILTFLRQVLVSRSSSEALMTLLTPKRAIEISSYEEMKDSPTSLSCSPYGSHLQQQQIKTAQNEIDNHHLFIPHHLPLFPLPCLSQSKPQELAPVSFIEGKNVHEDPSSGD